MTLLRERFQYPPEQSHGHRFYSSWMTAAGVQGAEANAEVELCQELNLHCGPTGYPDLEKAGDSARVWGQKSPRPTTEILSCPLENVLRGLALENQLLQHALVGRIHLIAGRGSISLLGERHQRAFCAHLRAFALHRLEHHDVLLEIGRAHV